MFQFGAASGKIYLPFFNLPSIFQHKFLKGSGLLQWNIKANTVSILPQNAVISFCSFAPAYHPCSYLFLSTHSAHHNIMFWTVAIYLMKMYFKSRFQNVLWYHKNVLWYPNVLCYQKVVYPQHINISLGLVLSEPNNERGFRHSLLSQPGLSEEAKARALFIFAFTKRLFLLSQFLLIAVHVLTRVGTSSIIAVRLSGRVEGKTKCT